MTILRDISFLWSMLHVLVIFLLFFIPRYPWGRTLLISFAGAGTLLICNVLAMYWLGHGIIMSIAFFTCTLPTLALFYVLSKYRDGRFFFLFCVSDTLCFWLLQLTNFLDRLAGDTYVVLLLGRLVIFPAAELLIWRYLRRPFLELQTSLLRGCGTFAVVGAVYYLLIMVTAVPVDAPMPDLAGLLRILLVMILMPLTYITILRSLWRQMLVYEGARQAELRRRDYQAICQKMELERIYRHDMRHHLTVMEGMLLQGDSAGVQQYISELQGKLSDLTRSNWCPNTAINSVLTSYFSQAKEAGCRLETKIQLPAQFPYDEMDLCMILSNALENALHALQELAETERWMKVELELTDNRRLTLAVRNACPLPVRFGPDGLPLTPPREGHGLGLRSIQSTVKRYGGLFRCQWEEGSFLLQAVLFPAQP